ncbi:MAG: anaerobic ribonucleoside-triphosphate reductase, partial [Candidatus Altiarchaeota archaeon]|nr:anaerobic ribonucleoside-triphosphate reductase [Candidatus Altiarchaeota archaeon]
IASKYGTPYILNRKKQFNGFRRGTIQHISINLPQIGYCRGDTLPNLENRMKKAFEVLLLKKKVMEKNLEHNLLPFLKQKASGLRYYNPSKQQYVISYTGLNELVKTQTNYGLDSREGVKYGLKIVKHMKEMTDLFCRESGLDFVLTGDPKGICYTRFAKIDSNKFPEKARVNGGANQYYSKTHYINHESLWEKLDNEGKFNTIVGGRTTTHVRLNSNTYTPDDMKTLLAKILSRKDVTYLSVSRPLTMCVKCGNTQVGKGIKCGKCKSKSVSVWARDTGHLQNTKMWNPSQKQAFIDEYRYDLKGDGEKISKREKKIILK